MKALVVAAAFWIPLGGCTALALMPGSGGAGGFALHLAAFAYLSVALCLAHFRNGPLLAVALWLFAFGVLIEVAQTFVDGRSSEFADLATNALGIGIGCAAYFAARRARVALA